MNRILILGATSTVAGEVARIYASRNAAMHLVARSREKLDAVAQTLPGPITTDTQDFGDTTGNEATIRRAIEALGAIDTVLIAHGALGSQLESERSWQSAEETLRTNFTSVVSLLIPLANHMEANRRGTIGVITSVAGDRGRPRNYTYGAAKGALHIYLQGLRSRLYPSGVKVTTLKLGPTDTPMTTTHKKTLIFSKPANVAKDIVHAMDAGTPEAYVPSFWGAIMPVVKSTPERLFQALPFLSGR